MTDLFAGAALLGRGAGLLLRRPRLFLLGALPPLVTSVIFLLVLVLLVVELDPITQALTPFADSWGEGAALTTRLAVGFVLVAGSVLVMVLTFSALTLALGAPVYDQISEAVDRSFPAPTVTHEDSVAAGAVRAVRQTVATLAVSVLGAAGLALVGLVPVVGQVAAAVVGGLFGGWMLALELVGSPLEHRGVLTLAERRQVLRRRRLRSLGLGVPSFLLLAVPFLAVVVFPVATAAGTLLARQLRDEPT